jgi:hypothetical protein
MTSRMVSPNELQAGAKEAYLNGKEPSTTRDWQLCVNFWAANISKELEESVCLLMKRLYSCPLSDEMVKEIAQHQAKAKVTSVYRRRK